jgi:hypothetical protein
MTGGPLGVSGVASGEVPVVVGGVLGVGESLPVLSHPAASARSMNRARIKLKRDLTFFIFLAIATLILSLFI